MKTKEEQGIELLKNIIYEKCVSCGALTRVPKDMHIDHRVYYIEGVGQLCDECGEELKYKNFKIMKKFKTRKELLECPEFKKLAFDLLIEELPSIPDDTSVWDEEIGYKVEKFIDRKMKQCIMEGV